jgi:hypothetical protein
VPLVAWCLSLCPSVAAWAGLELPESDFLTLSLLPWLALAGLPRRATSPARAAWRAGEWVFLALPPCAFGAALDARAGDWPVALVATLAAGLLLSWLGALAAERAADRPGDRVYPALWLAWVPGMAALLFALRFAPLPGDEPAGLLLEKLALAHPLAWAWREQGPIWAWPLGAAILLWLVARERARRAP